MIDCEPFVLSCNCTKLSVFIGTIYVVFVYAMIAYLIKNGVNNFFFTISWLRRIIFYVMY